MDDKTHGDGGDRKGRTENSIRCGFWDKGEVIGQKHASHTSSMAGGSNAEGEPMPPWFSVASKTVDPAIFRLGPVAQVNGKSLPSHGRCNDKGSITSDFAVAMIDEAVVPMLNAHGGVSQSKKAVMACDGVTTHMTSQFLDKCKEQHIVVVFRTPQCTNSEQPEDLLNFWLLKNAKDVGWYKVKQNAIFKRLGDTQGASSTLSHAKQLQLVVPCWNVAFSKRSNITAWGMVCACLHLCVLAAPALAVSALAATVAAAALTAVLAPPPPSHRRRPDTAALAVATPLHDLSMSRATIGRICPIWHHNGTAVAPKVPR